MDTKKIAELIDRHTGKKSILKPFGRTENWVLFVPGDSLVLVGTLLRQEVECRFDVAESVCASISEDKKEEKKLFLSYFLSSTQHTSQIVLRTELPLENEQKKVSVDSLSQIWPSVALQEMEQGKLFGIEFKNMKKTNVTIDYGLSDEAFPLRKTFFWEETFI